MRKSKSLVNFDEIERFGDALKAFQSGAMDDGRYMGVYPAPGGLPHDSRQAARRPRQTGASGRPGRHRRALFRE